MYTKLCRIIYQQRDIFQAQRRQYEGLLQHQIQSKMQASDYLTQAYLSVSQTAHLWSLDTTLALECFIPVSDVNHNEAKST